MFKKRDVELIVLEVLGCQDETDKKSLQFLKENDESFCWKELGECQNLSALLPSILKSEEPSTQSKEIIVRRLNRLIFGKEDISQTEKYDPGRKKSDEENLEKVLAKNKIDWGSLSVSASSTKQMSGFKEVRPRTTSLKRETLSLKEIENFSQVEENELTDDNHSNFNTKETVNKSSTLKKYILMSILLFVVIVSMSYYLFLNNKSETVQIAEEKKPVDNLVTAGEELSYDGVK
ncbi:MAG TPA: hypothetical protein VIY47_06380, partial [Ignavibacteriaceae bacterium]